MTPTLQIWLQLLGLVALEVALLAGIAGLLERAVSTAAWRRIYWHICVLTTLVLLVVELTGVSRRVLVWPKTSAPAKSAVAQFPGKADGAPILDPVFRSKVLAKAAQARATAEPLAPAIAPTETPPRGRAMPSPVQDEFSATDSLAILGLGLFWFAGTATVLGRLALGRATFLLARRKWREVPDAALHECVEELSRNLGFRRGIRLIESKSFAGPVAFGWIRPTIGLPSDFATRFTPEQREAMLLHELAHLWSGDPAWHLLADLATGVLWWHPASWWMRRRLREASECAADETSLLLTNGPGVLAECLVALGHQLCGRAPTTGMGMAGNGFRSGLGRRVERLLELRGRAWRPPGPRRSALARMVGPTALAAATILCTAWAVPAPLNKGENMQTMKQTWKRSLAAFALLATFQSESNPARAEDKTTVAPVLPPGYQTTDVPAPPPGYQQQRANLAGAPIPTQLAAAQPMPAALAPEPFSGPPQEVLSSEQRSIMTKLNLIKVDSAGYDGLPLSEVIKILGEVALKGDPEKSGINFVFDRFQPASAGGVDPSTGLPVVAAEQCDLESVSIKLIPPLRHVRLVDVLEALTKVADHPIKYQVADYGVLFSPDTSRVHGQPFAFSPPQPPPALTVRTFKVDTNTFIPGLERAFGIAPTPASGKDAGSVQFKEMLRQLLQRLGVDMHGDKAVFYNDLTGIVMMRGTVEDVELFRAAVETLGGNLLSPKSPEKM